MAVNLSRNTKVFITTADLSVSNPVFLPANTWELQVLDGYSFSQSSDSSVVQLSEAGDTPVRGQRSFNNKRNPAEWSISTYMRPYRVAGAEGTADDEADAPELRLWSALTSNSLTNYLSTAGATPVVSLDTTDSDKNQLASFGLIFAVDNTVYAIENCAVNQAEVSFDLTGIATIAWSGMGNVVKKITTSPLDANKQPDATKCTIFPITVADAKYAQTFITNKLSTTVLASGFSGGTIYTVPLTGGTLTYTNNIEYVTPDTLGIVDAPIGYFTGSRTISGNITAYLRSGANNDTSQLIADSLANSTDAEPKYRLTINVGGTTAGNPYVVFNMPYTTIQFPTIEIQDVVSTTINFTAQGASAGNFEVTANNELTVEYHPAAA